MGKGNKRKREPTPPSEDFGDSEYSEEEFSSESEGSSAPSLPRRRPMTRMTLRGLPRRSGLTSGPSSAPGSRARMSRSTPRTRRTRPRRTAKVTTTTTEATTAMTVTAATGAATATAAAAGAATAAAARAATRSVARCHWSLDISIV
jgi:hypothetical protein